MALHFASLVFFLSTVIERKPQQSDDPYDQPSGKHKMDKTPF